MTSQCGCTGLWGPAALRIHLPNPGRLPPEPRIKLTLEKEKCMLASVLWENPERQREKGSPTPHSHDSRGGRPRPFPPAGLPFHARLPPLRSCGAVSCPALKTMGVLGYTTDTGIHFFIF